MKKSVAVIIALIMLMTATLFGCGKKQDEQGNTPSEQTTLSTENTSDVQQSTSQQSLADKYPSGSSAQTETTTAGTAETTSQPAQQETTKEAVNESTSAPVVSQPSVTPSAPSENKNGAYRIDACQKILETGTYNMTVLMEDEDQKEPMPVAVSVKNGNTYMGMEMEGMSVGMLYRADIDKAYMIIGFFNAYTDVSEDMMGEDFNISQLTDQFKANITSEISVEKGTFEGKSVTTESYTDGKLRVKYHFDSSDNLVGIEKVDDKGKVDKLVIENFGAEVDDSVFEIPEGYVYMNLSAFM